MKKSGLLFLVVFTLHFVSSTVVINEFELNPEGTDAGNEWVELYNTGSLINVSGWYVTDKDGNQIFLPNTTIINFLVLDNLNAFVNTGENISLFNNFNVRQDNTGEFSDTPNDNRTWARLPDGTGNFTFQNGTKGFPNQPTIIQNKENNPVCILENENVTLNVNVTGLCTEQVIFSVSINGTWQNFTGVNTGGNTYRVTINYSLLPISQQINWTVYVTDCANHTTKNGIEHFYINSRTFLSVFPLTPDGIFPWYISEPEFTLTNPDATQLFYRWDSTGTLNYTFPFKLENAPNNGEITAGVLELTYWSNICNEPEQFRIFKTDFTNPVIKDIVPENNSIIFNPVPEISAYLDDIYQSNSGVNLSSIKIFLDDINIASQANISTADTLDATVIFKPATNLSLGQHNVTINISDNAGRNSQLTWMFEINISTIFNFTIYSPQNISYGTRRIKFNITATQIVEKIEFINHNERNPKFRILCRTCNEYGFKRERKIILQEGINNLTIKLTDQFGATKEQNISLFIDSEPPKISKTEPRKNTVTNGSDFMIKYSEDNLKEIFLSWNPNVTLANCTSGKNQICSTNINLSNFDNQFINYKFTLSDGINVAESKEVRVMVDTISPGLNISSPLNTTYEMKAPFNITISEKVLLEYFDVSSFSPRWKRLCSNCNEYGNSKSKFIRFKEGPHKVLIRAVDDAGNSDIENISFTII